ncbi:MAG: hypothetical protein ACRDRK_27095 [Pseudonocardia sp.]
MNSTAVKPVVVTSAVGLAYADLIAVAVLACPDVAGLHGGRFGEVATYLPGRQVTGVRITPTDVFVHVIARYPATVDQIDTAVRIALVPHVGALSVTLTIEDMVADLPAKGGPVAGRPVMDRPDASAVHPHKETLP